MAGAAADTAKMTNDYDATEKTSDKATAARNHAFAAATSAKKAADDAGAAEKAFDAAKMAFNDAATAK
jgi:hypothetical protein